MAVHVAMLRGINLGPRRRVPMADLRTLLTDAGYEDVRTYVQSGNIVLRSPAKPAEVERELQTLISERFGFDVPVIVRSRAQLAAVVKADPLGDVADDPKRYQVSFLCRESCRADVVRRTRGAGHRSRARGGAAGARSTPGTPRAWRAPSCGTSSPARDWGSPRRRVTGRR